MATPELSCYRVLLTGISDAPSVRLINSADFRTGESFVSFYGPNGSLIAFYGRHAVAAVEVLSDEEYEDAIAANPEAVVLIGEILSGNGDSKRS